MNNMDYKKHYESMCQANAALQNENVLLRSQVKVLEAEKKQWIRQKMVQERTFQDSLNNFNERMNKVLEENQRLKNGNKC